MTYEDGTSPVLCRVSSRSMASHSDTDRIGIWCHYGLNQSSSKLLIFTLLETMQGWLDPRGFSRGSLCGQCCSTAAFVCAAHGTAKLSQPVLAPTNHKAIKVKDEGLACEGGDLGVW